MWLVGNQVWNKKRKRSVKIIELQDQKAKVQNKNRSSPYTLPYTNLEHIEHRMNGLIKNTMPKTSIHIDKKWISIQSKEFLEWIPNNFGQYILTEQDKETMSQVNKSKGFQPFKHQQFLRDYLQNESPYRGILLYHGLGSGKTCTSLTIAEGLRKSGKTVIIMLPASLRNDFMQDGILFCADKSFQKEPELVEKYYSFVSYNASNKLEQLRALGSLDDRVIIIEEAHNFISQVANGSYHAREMYEQLIRAKNTKIISLTGTPLINEVYEIALLMNLLRGVMEVHRFQLGYIDRDFLTKQSIWKLECMKDPRVDTIYIDILQKVVEVQIHIPFYESMKVKKWREDFIHFAQTMNIPLTYIQSTSYRLFPDDKDGETFQNEFMDIKEDGTIQLKHENIFQRRLQGLISYYTPNLKTYPKVIRHPLIEVEMSSYQFILYEMIREIEKAAEKVTARALSRKKGRLSDNKSYFRIFSRQFGNFVFPETIERPFKRYKLQQALHQTLHKILHPNEKNQEKTVELTKEDILLEEENTKLSSDYVQRVEKAMEELKKQSNTLKLDGSSGGLRKYSPKMAYCLERMKESEGLIFFYSQFKTLEGLQIMGEVLSANQYSFLDVLNISNQDIENWNMKKGKYYVFYTGEEDFDTRTKIKKIYRDPRNKFGEYLQVLLATSAGAEGLDLKNIRQVHIFEPYWNNVRKKQVEGRAIRLNSHRDLLEKDRVVEIFEYVMVFSDKQKNETREKFTSDQYLFDIALKKEEVTNRVLTLLKEVAVDCRLFSKHHNGSYQCLSYTSNSITDYAYLPSIHRDFVYQVSEKKEKKKKVFYNVGGIDKDRNVWVMDPETRKFHLERHYESRLKPVPEKKISFVKKVAIDIHEHILYEYQSVKTMYPIKLGTINEDSQWIE